MPPATQLARSAAQCRPLRGQQPTFFLCVPPCDWRCWCTARAPRPRPCCRALPPPPPPQGELIRDSRAIARNYLKFWFWIDLFGTIPFDDFVIAVGIIDPDNTSDGTLAALGFLKAPRMLRLGRLLRFMDRMKNAKMMRIVQLFMFMCLLSHWLACVWYMMYRFGGKDGAEDWTFNVQESDSEAGGATAYVITYYQSFLLLVRDGKGGCVLLGGGVCMCACAWRLPRVCACACLCALCVTCPPPSSSD